MGPSGEDVPHQPQETLGPPEEEGSAEDGGSEEGMLGLKSHMVLDLCLCASA